MDDFKICIVGTGFAARQHAQNFKQIENFRLVGVCSKSSERADSFAQQYSATGYDNVEKMIDCEKPNVVAVATGEYDHVEPVMAALAGSAHVFCEKMLAHNLSDAEAIIAAAKDANRQVGVNYNYPFVPAHQLLKRKIDTGAFGSPTLCTLHTHSYLWPHLLHTIRYLFGDPTEVSASVVDDVNLRPRLSGTVETPWQHRNEILYHPSAAATACLVYTDTGLQVVLSASSTIPMATHWWSLALYGRTGFIKIDNASRDTLNGELVTGDGADEFRALGPFNYEDTFTASIREFAKALTSGRDVPVSGSDALKTMQLDARIAKIAARPLPAA